MQSPGAAGLVARLASAAAVPVRGPSATAGLSQCLFLQAEKQGTRALLLIVMENVAIEEAEIFNQDQLLVAQSNLL